jgi:hypothetical protein
MARPRLNLQTISNFAANIAADPRSLPKFLQKRSTEILNLSTTTVGVFLRYPRTEIHLMPE